MSVGRRSYLYTVALLSYLALLAALVFGVRHLLSTRFGDQVAAAGRGGDTSPLWLIGAGIVALIWGGHWFLANRPARQLTMAGATERGASPRKAALYIGQGVTLGAAAALSALAIAAVVRWGLGGPQISAGWPAEPLSLAAGAFFSLLFWGYLRWETRRDGDFGHEPGKAILWRRAYLYAAALEGSLMALVGAGETLRLALTFLNRVTTAGWDAGFANALAALLTGAPLALLAWRSAEQATRMAPRAEMHALSRVFLRYGGLLIGTLVTLTGVGYLLAQVILFALGSWIGAYWGIAAAYLLPAAFLWLASRARHPAGCPCQRRP